MTDRPPLVVQISRGLSPAIAIAETVRRAMTRGWHYELVTGLPLAEAKNTAAGLAYTRGQDLILVEDDVLILDDVWPRSRADLPRDAVSSITVPMVNGHPNCTWSKEDPPRVVYFGSSWMCIPLEVLQRLSGSPWFRPGRFRVREDRLVFLGEEGNNGKGSDLYLCWRCQEAGIPLRVIGRGLSLLHPYSSTNEIFAIRQMAL